MVGGDDQPALRRHVLESVKFNLEEHTTEKPNNRPEDLELPLRQHRATRRRSFLFFDRKCAVRAHVRFILQRPFPIYELDMNSGNTVGARAARANSRMRRDAMLLANQPDEPTFRYLQRGEE